MAEIQGTELEVTFNATNIEAYLMDDLEAGAGTRERHDKTAYGAAADAHFLAAVKKNEPITIGGVFSDAVVTNIFPLLDTTDDLEIFPKGDASGRPVLSGSASLHDFKYKSGGPMGKSTWTAVLCPSGDFPWGTV